MPLIRWRDVFWESTRYRIFQSANADPGNFLNVPFFGLIPVIDVVYLYHQEGNKERSKAMTELEIREHFNQSFSEDELISFDEYEDEDDSSSN